MVGDEGSTQTNELDVVLDLLVAFVQNAPHGKGDLKSYSH